MDDSIFQRLTKVINQNQIITLIRREINSDVVFLSLFIFFQVTEDIGPMDVPSDREDSTITPNLCSFTFLLVYSFTTKNLDLLSMLYKLSYYFFSILQFFNEMLKQKNCVLFFFGAPVLFKQKVFWERNGHFNQGSPCLSIFLSVILFVSTVFAELEQKTGNYIRDYPQRLMSHCLKKLCHIRCLA